MILYRNQKKLNLMKSKHLKEIQIIIIILIIQMSGPQFSRALLKKQLADLSKASDLGFSVD